ncbi:MAG: hypothetical protein EAX96_07410 [Candidatus Lokiarchaeota archaeon]|nr:hypothetical protein [Candidatus Lokiarchaeota archaeon]
MNYFKQLRDLILFILLLWGIILLGLFIIDILIVPLPHYFPQVDPLTISIFQVGITGSLILLFLFVWDRILAYYYKKNYNKRMKKV